MSVELLVRDPNSNRQTLPSCVKLSNFDIKTVEKLKYLGIYISDNLNRALTVRERVKAAYKVTYSLIPFLKKHKLSVELISQVYRSVIAPVITFGLKASAIT